MSAEQTMKHAVLNTLKMNHKIKDRTNQPQTNNSAATTPTPPSNESQKTRNICQSQEP